MNFLLVPPFSLTSNPLFPSRYEQLTLRADALREELHSKTERILNDIIKFKVHIQKSLEDLEGLVVEEVERELGGGGEGEDESEEDVDGGAVRAGHDGGERAFRGARQEEVEVEVDGDEEGTRWE